MWTFGKVVMETAALNAVAGRPKEEYGLEPQSLDEVRPGCYDVHERVKDMDAGRCAGLHELPGVPHVHGPDFLSDDLDLSLASSVRTTTGTWTSGVPPTRPASSPWPSPPSGTHSSTADEVRRVAAKGCHSLSFTENPAALGYPSFHDEYWDPVWQACCDTGTVLAIHLGSSGRLSIPAVDSPPDVMITLQPMNIQSAAADLLWSRVIKNFPDIRVALSEGGTGWIPISSRGSTGPSRCTVPGRCRTSAAGSRARCSGSTSSPASSAIRSASSCGHEIGIDNIAWEADYPHSDSMWPDAPEELGTEFSKNSVPEGDIKKMTHENAMRWYWFDPFAYMDKSGGHGGRTAPRAAGHDVAIMSRSTRVRTADEKLGGYRARARRAVAAGPVRRLADEGSRPSKPPSPPR